MNELEARIASSLDAAFDVQVGRVQFGDWGTSDTAAKLGDHELLVLQVDGNWERACLDVLALWAHLEESPATRAVIVRVTSADADGSPNGRTRLASFLSMKLCDEVPEQFCCFAIRIDDAGTLSGEVDELRERLSEARADAQ